MTYVCSILEVIFFYLVSYSNAYYVRNLVNRKSTSDIIQYLGTTLVSWSSKKQNTVALCTADRGESSVCGSD